MIMIGNFIITLLVLIFLKILIDMSKPDKVMRKKAKNIYYIFIALLIIEFVIILNNVNY